MLHHPTLEKLQTLRLAGMYKALTEQMTMPESETLGFEERLGLLADRSWISGARVTQDVNDDVVVAGGGVHFCLAARQAGARPAGPCGSCRHAGVAQR